MNRLAPAGEAFRSPRLPSRRTLARLGRLATVPVLAVALTSGCASSATARPNSPTNFFVVGSTLYPSGRETLALVGCLNTGNDGRGGTSVGSNLNVGSTSSSGVAETLLGNSYEPDPSDKNGVELTGTAFVDTAAGIFQPDGTIDALKLANYIATHPAASNALSDVPPTYDGATCVRDDVEPKEVRTYDPASGGYSPEVPFPSPAADDMIATGTRSIVNLTAGLLTVLAVPVVP